MVNPGNATVCGIALGRTKLVFPIIHFGLQVNLEDNHFSFGGAMQTTLVKFSI